MRFQKFQGECQLGKARRPVASPSSVTYAVVPAICPTGQIFIFRREDE
jgi:hypothetical protein